MPNTGVMLAFYLSDENAQRLALPGGEVPAELHVTLVYFGDMNAVENVDKLPAIAQEWAGSKSPIEGVVNGGGRFSPGEDGRTPLYANFDAPDLPAWRQDLVNHMAGQGYEPQATHGYTPHITLAYSEPDAAPPSLPDNLDIPITFDTLTLKVGDERHDFPLNVQEMIRQQDDGWHLYSKDGEKHLGGPYPERADAEDRERQVQAFKHKGEGAIMPDTKVIPARLRESGVTSLWPVQEAKKAFTGREWEVTIIGANTPADIVRHGDQEYVVSQNDRLYACEALRKSTPEWDGVKVYDNHLTDDQFQAQQGMRSVKDDWIGTIVQPRWDAARRRLRGIFKVVDADLAKKLLEAYEQKVLKTIGLSIDTFPQEASVRHEGKTIPVIQGFKKIFSVDLVAEPAAGGGFNRILASVQDYQEGNYELTPELQAFITTTTREAVVASLNGRAGQGLCTPGVQREIARLRETLDHAGVALEALEGNLSK